MDELAYVGVAEAARAFAEGTLTPVELVGHLLARIDRLDRKLHAFIRVDRDGAMARAREATREIASGRSRGPLHGVPIAVKDIIDIAGQPTTCHSAIRAGHVAAVDAPVISRLLDAGAIVIGKTSLHEFATGGPAFDLPWPPARNPWNVALHPGGSSSGSASAVAAGMACAALGTDTGGSVRNPATCCGIVGLKPTYDLIDRAGVFPLASSLDHVGLLTRSVEDAALLLDATAPPPASRANGAASHAAQLASDAKHGLDGVRVGVIEHFYREDDQADDEIVHGIEAAIDVLRGLGARPQAARLPSLKSWVDCGRTLQRVEQHAVHEAWLRERPGDYCELSRRKLSAGAAIPASDHARALAARQTLCAELDSIMRNFDVLVTVSSMTLPCAIDDAAAIARTYERHARMPFNVAGVPALSLPVGLGASGLPLAIQIAARRHDERALFRVGHAYERASGGVSCRPALD
jgi:aspartyl-tRNA(Asn)/glutamyl-tRNA(Gln) amidotransferase subunit A